MVVPAIVGGGALLGLGTIGGMLASDSRERALKRATRRREGEMEGINRRRQSNLDAFNTALNPLAADSQQNQLQMLQGLTGLGATRDAATQQGLQDIQAAKQSVFGLAPISQAFGSGSGPGAKAAANFQAQQAPLVNARNQLAAAGLGDIAAGRARGDVLRQGQLGDIRNQADLQRLRNMESPS